MGSLAKIIDATGASHEDLQSRANIFGIDLFCVVHAMVRPVVLCFSQRNMTHNCTYYLLHWAMNKKNLVAENNLISIIARLVENNHECPCTAGSRNVLDKLERRAQPVHT